MRLLSLLLRSSRIQQQACVLPLSICRQYIIMLRYNRATVFNRTFLDNSGQSAHCQFPSIRPTFEFAFCLNSKLFYILSAGPAHPLIIRLSIVIFLCAALLFVSYIGLNPIWRRYFVVFFSDVSGVTCSLIELSRPAAKRTQQGVQQMKSNSTRDKM